ncbi:MAG: glycosyl hydrolase [Syntrophomonadaceae bacterium]|nr:glycosyl hydrolase [Syntrophomonadaceae bacterium]
MAKVINGPVIIISIFLVLILSSPCRADINANVDNKLIAPLPDPYINNYEITANVLPGYNQYLDLVNGYSINYPASMNVDPSQLQLRTVIADNNTRIEIYRDDFTGSIHSATAYMQYSNRFLNNRSTHYAQVNKTISVNGLKVHLLQWQRNKLLTVVNDHNYYLSAEITKSSKEVYTVFIKSSLPVDGYIPLIQSFAVANKQGNPGLNPSYQRRSRELQAETSEFFQKYFGNEATLKWGIFEPSAPERLDYLHLLEKQMDCKFDFLILYKTFDAPFPAEELSRAYQEQRYVQLTLQTMFINGNNANITYDILNGKYDGFFTDYAKKARDFGHPLLFRLNNEMNGDWCVYSSYYSSKDTELYKAVWQHVYKIFTANQANNVLWVWNPNDLSFPGFKWNHALNYFPGEAYVDIIGLTGYNTGSYYPGEYWREFTSIYDPLYQQYSAIFDYPFIISEFGCNSVGGSKAVWIGDMFANMKKYSGIKAAIWFNGTDVDGNGMPARIYRLDENNTILNAFRKGFASPVKETSKE